jgi:acetylornithine deacetylase/succinyl-diaminopimelate desuccinylase-like protein
VSGKVDASPAIAFALEQRERFLGELIELLRIPSISTLPEHRTDMDRAAGWLRDRLDTIGIPAELIPGDGPPLVYGEWLRARSVPTVLVYGHYDVQPVDPLEEWITPPFEPSIRDGNLYARGASDDKGQTMTLIYAAESLLRATGRLPVNLKLLIEGQEEAGGDVVTQFIQEHGERLRADIAHVADTSMYAPRIPMIETGLRGNVYTEIYARGPAHDLHSGLYGGAAPNPLNALAQIIAGLKGADGRITIPGFYDDAVMPADDVRASWRELPFDAERFRLDEVGASALDGEREYTVLERMWARPTLDVHGIVGGFTGSGGKTVIPSTASAKISMRIVPNQRGEQVFDLFRAAVEMLTPPGIEVRVERHGCSDPVLVPTDSPAISAARRALAATFGRPAVLGRSGGSIPIVGLLKKALDIDTVLMGWGLADDNLHAPNEKITLANFYEGIDATIRFWAALDRV